MSNTKPDFQSCCNEVAEKYGYNYGDDPFQKMIIMTDAKVLAEAAQLYADRCVEEAKGTTNVLPEYEEGLGTYDVTECCRFGPIVDENYCPECGKKIIKLPIPELTKTTTP